MNQPADLGKAHLRVVRPSDDLAANVKFYRDGLGFEVLYEFRDHDGFDAVMLGRKEAAYHLAFVHKVGHKAGRAPGEDNLLVFYLPDADEWKRSVARLEDLGHKPVKAFNPYWDKKGKTFEDPDRAGRLARRSRPEFRGARTPSSARPSRAALPDTRRDDRDAGSRSPRRTCPRRRAASARRSCARPGPPR